VNADYFRTFWDYVWWTRDRMLVAADGMTEEEYAQPNGFNYDGLRSVLTHMLAAEASWFSRLRGEPVTRIVVADVPDLRALRDRWLIEQSKARLYLDGLTDTEVSGDVTLPRRDGTALTTPLWVMLAHLSNHATQHRAEASEMLTMIGRSPGDMDLLGFYLERRGG